MSLRVILSLAAAPVLVLAACGGGPPDPAKLYDESGEKMRALTAFHLTVEVQGGEEPGTFEIDIVLPDAFHFTVEEEGETFAIIGVGDQFFFQVPGSEDYFLAPEEEEEAGFTPRIAAFATALTTDITGVTYVAKEEVDGVSVHHLQGTLAREVFELVDEPEELPPGDVTVDLWVGVDDSLVHRYRWSEDEETFTATVSRFNDDTISVVAPPNAKPFPVVPFFTPEQQKEAFADLTAEEEQCLRQVWGDAVFEELKAGARLMTEQEFTAGDDQCFAGE